MGLLERNVQKREPFGCFDATGKGWTNNEARTKPYWPA